MVMQPLSLEALESRRLMCYAHDGVGSDVGTYPAGGPIDLTPPPPAADAAPTAPALSSRPSALAKLFLDFDGDTSSSWGGFTPGTTPAYDLDGNQSSFNAQEQANINEIWGRVAEKYSPFNIDVTTIDPGNLTNLRTMRVVIGGTGSWYGSGAGGVAYVDSFTNSLPNTVWVFAAQNPNSLSFIAEASAHESGHGFGLQHQSTYDSNGVKTAEYNPGANGKAPIMGLSYNAQRGLWWSGPSSLGVNVIQNDLAVISRAANQFGYRTDDSAATIAGATALAGSNGAFSGDGLIENTSDVDMYSFTLTAGGPASLRTLIARSGGNYIGMLDSTLTLYNSAGSVIQTANTAALNENINANLLPGTYYLGVSSKGNYGDVGQYSVQVSQSVDTTSPSVNGSLFDYVLQQTMSVTFSEDVSPSLTAGDMMITNAATNETFTPDTLVYNTQSNSATFGFANFILPDGNYRATLNQADVADPFGNPLNAPFSAEFFVFGGDADRNRSVNVGDFARLAANFNLINRSFPQGDFNYDRVTNIADFAILASKFNTSLPAPRPAATMPGTGGTAAPKLFGDRLIDQIETM